VESLGTVGRGKSLEKSGKRFGFGVRIRPLDLPEGERNKTWEEEEKGEGRI